MSRTENSFYLMAWITAVLYSVYRFSVPLYKYFYNFKDEYHDFTEGILSVYLKRDKSDFEWESIGYILKIYFPCTLFYIFLNELIRLNHCPLKVSQLLQVLFILFYVYIRLGLLFVMIILLQPIIFYIVFNFNPTIYSVWVCSGISISSIAYFKNVSASYFYQTRSIVNEFDFFLITLSLSWMNLKCTSYYLDKRKQNVIKFLDFLSYCFYPPTFLSGPFISYEDYRNSFIQSYVHPISYRLKRLVWNILISLFWFLMGNICLHFIFVNAAAYHPSIIESLDSWSLYGFGYAMGQFFHIKYVVLYGLSTCLASFENIPVPRLPRCIGRIHLYSDMWKYFDPGLYKFLVKNLHVPLMKLTQSKLIASLASFAFVFIWHGFEKYILIWTSLNYFGIFIEYTVDYFYRNYLKKSAIMGNISSRWLRRLQCLLAAPLLAMSAISNFYFFGGIEIGNIFLYRLLNDTFLNYIILISVLYCCCQVSTEMKTVAARKCE